MYLRRPRLLSLLSGPYNRSEYRRTTHHSALEVKVFVNLTSVKRSQEEADTLKGQGFSPTFIAEGLDNEMKRVVLLDHFHYMMNTLGVLAETSPLSAMASFHSCQSNKLIGMLMDLHIVGISKPEKWPQSYCRLLKTLQNTDESLHRTLYTPKAPCLPIFSGCPKPLWLRWLPLMLSIVLLTKRPCTRHLWRLRRLRRHSLKSSQALPHYIRILLRILYCRFNPCHCKAPFRSTSE